MFLPFCLSFSVSLFRHLSTELPFLAIYLSTCLFMYLSIDLFIHLSTKLSIFLSIQPLSIHLLLSVSFFFPSISFIDPCPQLSISGNQLLELRTSLLKMPLVLRLATKNASVQILFKSPTPAIVFENATKTSRFNHFSVDAQSTPPTIQNDV